jgi:hypothetical protein
MIPVSYLLKHASEITTKEGNTYHKIPFWFEVSPDGSVVFHHAMPEDLSEFVCKAGLGNPDYVIKRPEE